jgi:hypothetical protein
MLNKDEVAQWPVYRQGRRSTWHFVTSLVVSGEPVTACRQRLDIDWVASTPYAVIDAAYLLGIPLRTCTQRGCREPWNTVSVGSRDRVFGRKPKATP